MFPLILNFVICISQILLVLIYSNNMNSLMIFGSIVIAFGTGLNTVVEYLKLKYKSSKVSKIKKVWKKTSFSIKGKLLFSLVICETLKTS